MSYEGAAWKFDNQMPEDEPDEDEEEREPDFDEEEESDKEFDNNYQGE